MMLIRELIKIPEGRANVKTLAALRTTIIIRMARAYQGLSEFSFLLFLYFIKKGKNQQESNQSLPYMLISVTMKLSQGCLLSHVY